MNYKSTTVFLSVVAALLLLAPLPLPANAKVGHPTVVEEKREVLRVERRNVDEPGDAHDDEHADEEDEHAHEEENEHCPVTSEGLAHEFTELAEELLLTGEEGEPCRAPGEEEEHGHEEEEEEEEEEHTSASNGTCGRWFDFTRQLLLRLNLTTPCCLGNDSSSCEETEKPVQSSRTTTAQAYGYGFLLVVLVSLASLLGLFLLPLAKNPRLKQYYQYLYALLISLGASALFCDAILHLIPEAFGLHGHGAEEEAAADEHAHEEEEDELLVVWRACMVILGMYAFFLFEFVLHSWVSHSHSATPTDSDSTELVVKTDEELETMKCADSADSTEGAGQKKVRESTFPHGECREGKNGILHPTNRPCSRESCRDDNVNCCKMFGRYMYNIKPLAWLIVIGDSIHNFADGLALGAAIAGSLSLGISTTIALIFHEIPHEVGDYFILLSTGMSWYVALLFNFVSALTAILGFFVGVAIGTSSEEANSWILAAAAGIFLYIALVDLLPELIHGKERGCKRAVLFVMVNVGFIVSFIALLLLAIYEDDLNSLVEV